MMRNIFDYTFYRTAKRHFKSDGANAFTATLAISFIVFLFFVPLFDFIMTFLFGNTNLLFNKILISLFGILIFFLVKKKYNGKYFSFRDKWINETKREKLFGEILIVIFFFSPLLLMLIIKKAF